MESTEHMAHYIAEEDDNIQEKEKLLEELDHMTSRTETIGHLPEHIHSTVLQIELGWPRWREEMRLEFTSLLDMITTWQHDLMTHLEQEVLQSLQALKTLRKEYDGVIQESCQLTDDCIAAVQDLSNDDFLQTRTQLLASCSQLESRVSSLMSPEDCIPVFLTQPFSLNAEKIYLGSCCQTPAPAASTRSLKDQRHQAKETCCQTEDCQEHMSATLTELNAKVAVIEQLEKQIRDQEEQHQRELSRQQEQHQRELLRQQEQHKKELSRQDEQYQTELLSHQEKAIDLQVEIEQLEKKLVTQLAQHSHLKEEVSKLQKELMDKQAINVQLKERQKMLVSQRDQYKEQLKAIDGRADTLGVTGQQERQTRASDHQSVTDQLKQGLEMQNSQLLQYKGQLKVLNVKITDKHGDTDQQDGQTKANYQQSVISQLNQKIQSQHAQLGQYKEQVSCLRTEMARFKTKHERQLRACNDRHSPQMSAVHTEIRLLKKQYDHQTATQKVELNPLVHAATNTVNSTGRCMHSGVKAQMSLAEQATPKTPTTGHEQAKQESTTGHEQAKHELRELEERTSTFLQTLHNLRVCFVQDLQNRISEV